MSALKGGVIFAVTGVAIGWLAGMSVSPVLGIVLTSIMATLAAVFAALPTAKSVFSKAEARDETHSATADAPALLCALVVGMSAGSGAGIWARTHFWFAPSDIEVIEHWKSLGLDGNMVAQRLFETRLPTDAVSANASAPTPIFPVPRP